jgi:hypothetical protein
MFLVCEALIKATQLSYTGQNMPSTNNNQVEECPVHLQTDLSPGSRIFSKKMPPALLTQ